MGDSLNNSTYVQGGAAGLTAEDVWNVAFSTAFDAGSMGDSLNNWSYVQSSLIAMDFWNISFGASFDAGSMGDSLNNSTYVQGGAAGLTPWDIWGFENRQLTIFDEDSTTMDLDGTTMGDLTIKTGYKLADDGTEADTSFTNLQAVAAGVKAKTDNLPADPADDSDIDNQLSSIQQDLNNPDQYKATGFAVAGDPMTLQSDSLATLMADVDGVKAKTDNLPTDPADDSDIDGQLATIQTDLDNPSQYQATGFAVKGDPMTLQSDTLSGLMANVDGIKAKTDNLPSDPADDSDIDAQLNSIATDLNTPDQYKADVWANVDTTDADTSDIGVWLVNNTGGAGGGSDLSNVWRNQDTTHVDTSDIGLWLYNNLRGAAAGLTAAELADTLFNRGYVPGTGTGANQVIVRTKSSVDSAVIPGATIAVWNADQTALLRLLDTDTDSGKAIFAVNNGTYNLRIQAYKFQFQVPITIGVSGNKDTTVYATEFTPSPPPSVDMCVVYGYIDSIGLAGQRAKISCTIHQQQLRVGTKLLGYFTYTKTAYTNPSGYWEMALYPNSLITPTDTQYEFEITTPYQPVLKKWVTVPEQLNWEFTW